MPRTPPSDQNGTTDIYVQYAHLMTLSQVAEQIIALFVSFARTAFESTALRPPFEDVLVETRRKTLGQLCKSLIASLQQIAPAEPPPDGLGPLLAELLHARNWLAHRYFLDRHMLMQDPTQHGLLLEELRLLTDHFVASTKLLQGFANAAQSVAHKDLAGATFDPTTFMRQRLFEEYGDVSASLRRLRTRPPFGLFA